MTDKSELERIREILSQNAGKEFVKRILDPENSPKLDLGGGYHGTHLMAAEYDPDTGHWLVFPTIVNMGEGGLQQLEVNQAFLHAKDRGEYIDFGEDKDSAISFSKNYKKVWE